MKIQINCFCSIDYYVTEQISATDYYQFGAAMPGRNFSSDKYRYGFNGKENDNEVKGNGNQVDYGERINDTRLGRFLSVDPLFNKQPQWSPYSQSGDNPIKNIDVNGLYFTGNTNLVKQVYAQVNSLLKEDPKNETVLAFKSMLEKMDASEVEFNVSNPSKMGMAGMGDGKGGETYFDFENNRVQLEVFDFSEGGNPSLIARASHELLHGGQFLTGDMDFAKVINGVEGSGGSLDYFDEEATVKIQTEMEKFESVIPLDKNKAKDQMTSYKHLPPFKIKTDQVITDFKDNKIKQKSLGETVEYKSIYNFTPNEKQKEEFKSKKEILNK